MSKILPRFPQWISPRISLPVANLGEIPGKIVPRFLPPWICSSARILARFAVAFRRDFGHQDYCFPVRILVRFAAGLRRDFGRQDFSSRRESWRDSRQDPGEILAAGNFISQRESCQDPGEIPAGKKNPGGQNVARIQMGLPPRSWRDPAKIPVLILQIRNAFPCRSLELYSQQVALYQHKSWLCFFHSDYYHCVHGWNCNYTENCNTRNATQHLFNLRWPSNKKVALSPCRKRVVNLRKMWHLLTLTGVHRSENPRFSNCFAVGEFEYSFHYPVFSHYGESQKTPVFWNSPVC